LLVLGLSGGLNPLHLPEAWPGNYHLPAQEPHVSHDSAAILLNDGEIIAGAEEERLNRVKHTNHLATLAIRLCLETAGASVRDIDHIAYFLSETNCLYAIVTHMLQNPRAMLPYDPHILLAQMLTACIGKLVRPEQIKFIEHHHAHAVSAYHVGPFEKALVVTIDGDGDGLSGAVFAGRAGRLTCLNRIPAANSLGHFYLQVCARALAILHSRTKTAEQQSREVAHNSRYSVRGCHTPRTGLPRPHSNFAYTGANAHLRQTGSPTPCGVPRPAAR
jgi:carbamoyltransferase